MKALFVYNSNPVAVAPEQEKVRAGFAREDLFIVVHDLFQTDTADFADIVLPATTTLEHYDIHKAYGHLYLTLSRPAIAPRGRVQAQHRGLPPAGRAPGPRRSRPARDRRADGPQALRWEHPHLRGITFERLEREGSVRLSVPDPYAPFAQGGLPDPVGQVRAGGAVAGGAGPRPGADVHPAARERGQRTRSWPRRYPLAFISPPAHHFLNSTFSAQPVFVRREGEPSLTIHPADAAARGIARRARWCAPSTTAARSWPARTSPTRRGPGVVVGLSIWWAKMCPGGRNANAVTSQELTDMGGGATFYDALVEVAPEPSRLMGGFFVAATAGHPAPVPARARPAAPPPALLFALLAGANSRDGWDAWGRLFHSGAWPRAWPSWRCCRVAFTARRALYSSRPA